MSHNQPMNYDEERERADAHYWDEGMARWSADEDIIDAELVDDEPSAIEPTAHEVARRGGGLAELRRGLLALDDQRAEMVRRQDADGLAHGIADVRDIITDLSALKRASESDLGAILIACHEAAGLSPRANPKHFVDGLGEVKVPGGTERKNWQSEDLLRRLVRETLYDTETGEARFDSPSDAADAIIEMLLSCISFTGSLSWKVGTWDKPSESYVGGLRSYGIEPEDFCDEGEKPRLAVIPKRPGS